MADLSDALVREPRSFGFFQAVSLLDQQFCAAAPGSDPVHDGRIRFESSPSTTFAASDIADCRLTPERATLILSFMSLVGASSPLPHYFGEHVLRHESGGGALSDFLDIFANRLYALFYGAWRKYRMADCIDRDDDSPWMRVLAALSAVHPERAGDVLASRLPAYAGLLATAPRSAEGLTALLSDFFGGMQVSVDEHAGYWAPLADRPALGCDALLGDTAVLGDAVWDMANRFRVIVGPLDRATYQQFLPGTKAAVRVTELIAGFIAEPLEFEVEVRLAAAELLPVVLGASAGRLGETASLGDAPAEGHVATVAAVSKWK